MPAQKHKSIIQGFAEPNGPKTRGDSTKDNYSKDWANKEQDEGGGMKDDKDEG